MSYRILFGVGKWLISIGAFFAISVLIANVFIISMTEWASEHGCSLGFVYEIRFLRAPILALCLISGAIYASALAKPGSFGGVVRIWRHLVGTYFCCLLGVTIFVRAGFLPLPDFSRHFEVNAYLFAVYGTAIACFVLGVFLWVRLAFGSSRNTESATVAEPTS